MLQSTDGYRMSHWTGKKHDPNIKRRFPLGYKVIKQMFLGTKKEQTEEKEKNHQKITATKPDT